MAAMSDPREQLAMTIDLLQRNGMRLPAPVVPRQPQIPERQAVAPPPRTTDGDDLPRPGGGIPSPVARTTGSIPAPRIGAPLAGDPGDPMSRLRAGLGAAAAGTASVQQPSGIIASLAGGFAGAQGFKRALEDRDAERAAAGEERQYERGLEAEDRRIAAEDRAYGRERDALADTRAERGLRIDETRLIHDIAKQEGKELSLKDRIEVQKAINADPMVKSLAEELPYAEDPEAVIAQIEDRVKALKEEILGKPPGAGQATGTGHYPVAPDAAVEYLRANPESAPDFDRKYGPGLSKRFLN